MKLLLYFFCLLILTSCTTDSQITNALQTFKGHNISLLAQKFGHPDEEKMSLIEDKKVFIWRTDNRYNSYSTKSQNSNVSYGNKWEAISAATNSISQGMNDIADRNSYCIIKIITDDSNIIEHI